MPDLSQKNSHCSYCGAAFPEDRLWPRRCHCCENVTYVNPLPVSVILQPITDLQGVPGLLLVQRVQEPKAGYWSLPGGFIESHETWQEAGARELFEETGYAIDPGGIHLFDTLSAPDGTLLVFGLASAQALDLSKFKPSPETSSAMIADGPMELAFSTHTQTAARYWKEIESHE